MQFDDRDLICHKSVNIQIQKTMSQKKKTIQKINEMAESKLSMKLLIDTSGKRVLFAEAGKECVDFLFHILSLPVATVVSLLGAEWMQSSLPTLYKSLENLSDTYIQPDQKKGTYLKPAPPVTGSPLLAVAGQPAEKEFYVCDGCEVQYVSDSPVAVCPDCGEVMATKVEYVAPAAGIGGLVKGVVTYMVMDDLEVKPMSTVSSVALLNTLKVRDVGGLEEKVVNLGIKEGVKLLKASLQSKKVLTDVFFN